MVIWLAFLAMVCWGIAPIFAKLGLANANPIAALVLRTMLAAFIVTTWVGFSGADLQLGKIPPISWLLIGIEAILATLVGDLAYYAAIKDGNVAVVTIIMSVAPLVTMVLSNIFLAEPITIWRIVGACYVVLGLILIM